ncbi:acyl-CoA dehydrogenase family protein [Parahaliea mediterranea]|uniref:Acyl-CoA/acyl-ACP dehydrogenase n=1 Tax=Parahaliea mediterranea TaxID=651086 RepID=A0A939DI36_9GAMM|nr:acyl-CoA dehydrogenase family protein [Parahaliea mediterranea]MBN7798653.1 acyl-CoA/acyl-ACP dehydrogenase [Parahaliea mediterranea]
MDFGFSDEQREVRDLARRILGEQVSPRSLQAYDEYAAPRFDEDLWRALLDAGLPGVAVAAQWGGMDFGFLELALFIEEVGRGIAPVPAIQHCVGGMLPLQRFGSAAQRARWLPAAVSGELLLTAALTETGNDWSRAPRCVTARRDGDTLCLRGRKSAVPFAAQADLVLLPAALEGGDDVAVVLLDPRGAGVTLLPCESTSFEPQAHLQLDNVRVPPEQVLVGRGGAAAMAWLAERMCAALCAHQLGAADAAMRMAASYTGERQQFGVPISTFQAVGHRMANCYIDVECLRLATYQACSLLHDEQAAALETRIAKVWAGDTGHRVSYATQHVHGGTGIDRDYPLWRYCLWLRHNEMTLGGSGFHLAAIGEGLAGGQGLFA